MLNWKFVQAQFKNIWIVLLLFGVAFLVVIACGNIYPSIANNIVNALPRSGAHEILNIALFGYVPFALFFSFGIILSGILLHRDLNRGYIASWMTTSMSRTTIFNSKLFALVSSTLLLNFWIILLELIFYGIGMGDFNLVIRHLLVGNLALMMFSLLIVAIPWIIFSLCQKNGLAIGITLAIGGWFTLCTVLYSFRTEPNLDGLKYFQYFNLLSLLNSPLTYVKTDWNIGGGSVIIIDGYEPLIPLRTLDFAWQIPSMLVGSVGLLIGGQYIIKNKDFSF